MDPSCEMDPLVLLVLKPPSQAHVILDRLVLLHVGAVELLDCDVGEGGRGGGMSKLLVVPFKLYYRQCQSTPTSVF